LTTRRLRTPCNKPRRKVATFGQFVRDAGIEVQVGGRIYIKDLWELLQKWYVETERWILRKGGNGKDKLIWHDLPNKYDTPVKATNQVFARFSEIFLKSKNRV
jgi:putative DNA primase/helicase